MGRCILIIVFITIFAKFYKQYKCPQRNDEIMIYKRNVDILKIGCDSRT